MLPPQTPCSLQCIFVFLGKKYFTKERPLECHTKAGGPRGRLTPPFRYMAKRMGDLEQTVGAIKRNEVRHLTETDVRLIVQQMNRDGLINIQQWDGAQQQQQLQQQQALLQQVCICVVISLKC